MRRIETRVNIAYNGLATGFDIDGAHGDFIGAFAMPIVQPFQKIGNGLGSLQTQPEILFGNPQIIGNACRQREAVEALVTPTASRDKMDSCASLGANLS